MNAGAPAAAHSCPLCGSGGPHGRLVSRDHEHDLPGDVTFTVCGGCGTVVQTPLPDAETLLRAYPEDYHAYHEYASPLMARLKDRYYRRRALEYGRLVGARAARVLDVGCGDGAFMLGLRRAHPGWDVVGVDFNPHIVARGRARGLDVRQGTLEDVKFEDGAFDLVVMHHMIEHAFDPLATLRETRRILRPSGVLVGETPNVDCWDFTWFGGGWGGLHTPRHTMLFTPGSLTTAAGRAGLERLWVRHSVQPAHLALSVQHWLQARRLTRVRLHRGRAFYYPYLLVLLTPPAILQALRRRSGVISFAFRRPRACPDSAEQA